VLERKAGDSSDTHDGDSRMRNDPSCLAWLAIIGSSLDPLTIDSMLRLPPALTHSGKSPVDTLEIESNRTNIDKGSLEVKFEIGDDKIFRRILGRN